MKKSMQGTTSESRPSTGMESSMRGTNQFEPQTEGRPLTVSLGNRPTASTFTNSSGFRDSIDRFSQYASVRTDFTNLENMHRSHLGPGCHNRLDKGRSSVPTAAPRITKLNGTKVPQCFTIFASSNAPPIGTYTVNSICSFCYY